MIVSSDELRFKHKMSVSEVQSFFARAESLMVKVALLTQMTSKSQIRSVRVFDVHEYLEKLIKAIPEDNRRHVREANAKKLELLQKIIREENQ